MKKLKVKSVVTRLEEKVFQRRVSEEKKTRREKFFAIVSRRK